MNTGDSKNLIVQLNTTFNLIWASNPTANLVFHKAYGTAQALINSDGGGGGDIPIPPEPATWWDPWVAHGWFMWVSWFILGFV